MSERDFEIYLSLLARMLRLSAVQRDAIADELRDHLEERLDELLSGGLTRQQAVAAALEEFGDAAGLAHRFTAITTQRRRRLIMRYSFASLAALALGATIVLTTLPERRDVPVQALVWAQKDQPPHAQQRLAANTQAPDSALIASVKESLQRPMDEVDWSDLALEEIIADLRERTGVNIVVNWSGLDAAGIDRSAIVADLQLRSAPAAKVLRLVLDEIGGDFAALDYIIDADGIVLISTADALSRTTEIRIYNVRDLLGVKDPATSLEEMADLQTQYELLRLDSQHIMMAYEKTLEMIKFYRTEGADEIDEARAEAGAKLIASEARRDQLAQRYGEVQRTLMSLEQALEATRRRDESAERLVTLIMQLLEPHTWHSQSGVGAISHHDGTLIINHNVLIHQKVDEFLKMLRRAGASFEGDVIAGVTSRSPRAGGRDVSRAIGSPRGFGPGVAAPGGGRRPPTGRTPGVPFGP